MMHAILFDTEFLTAEGAPQRFWNGPRDPDPLVVQIGAVRLDLVPPFAVAKTLSTVIRPRDRHGAPVAPDPLFTRLTGLEAADLEGGVDLATGLAELRDFAGDAPLWSWGKDELNLMGVSCFIAGLAPSIPAHRFGNLCALMPAAGMPYDDVKRTRSPDLPAWFGLDASDLRAHDALGDALALARVVIHLLGEGHLRAEDLRRVVP